MAEDPVPRYEPFADGIVREAIERGEFDNLPGKGKPLHLKRVGDPDWWIKDKLEREQLDHGELRRQWRNRRDG